MLGEQALSGDDASMPSMSGATHKRRATTDTVAASAPASNGLELAHSRPATLEDMPLPVVLGQALVGPPR
ncbi:hypothetical protein HRbin28_00123 [bacterium HR28]|nr:hypothetical protein HRbin28_00123 [bacterium HR28]